MEEELVRFLQRLGRPRICVVGDVMLDTYVWGQVSGVSPEGPIPVLQVDRREHRPGGAASVAAMLCALGAEVSCVGVVGEDDAARELRRELQARGADTSGLVSCLGRPTTLKTRYVGYVQSAGRALQQILRVDEESASPIRPRERKEVLARVGKLSRRADVILVQDMAKGLLQRETLKNIISSTTLQGKAVLVDPEGGDDYSGYKGATCLLPNRSEAETATGVKLNREESYSKAAEKLLKDLSLKSVVIKLDREGIFYATADGEQKHITTHARDVADVAGAGDMVAAVVAMGIAGGMTLGQAAELANLAAGVEVSRQGAAAISRTELVEELRSRTDPVLHKIKTREQLLQTLSERRKRGEKVAFTNGVFDLLHLGHMSLIRHARAQADCLVVAVNSDRSAQELKGPGRPINAEQERARMLAALADVDYVVIFGEVSVRSLVELVRPEVLVKGGDYDRTDVVGHEFVESYGGTVELAPEVEGLSTSELIQRIARNDEGQDSKDY